MNRRGDFAHLKWKVDPSGGDHTVADAKLTAPTPGKEIRLTSYAACAG